MRQSDDERTGNAATERVDPWTEGFDWDVEEQDAAPERPRRGRILLIAGLLPWVVIAALVLRPGSAPEAEAGAPDAVASAVPSGGEPAELADGQIAIVPSGEVAEVPDAGFSAQVFGPRVSAGASDAAAVAVVVARDWLETVATDLDAVDLGRTTGGGYVEHLAVESVDMPTAGGAIVTLVGILLDVQDGEYRRARPVRVAVPVSVDAGGAQPAGTPWWLPPPDLTLEEPAWQPVDDPDLLVRAGEAITLAGYRDVAVERAERTEGWPVRVTFTAVAPGQDASATHVVWLREHLGEYVVAGWLPGIDATAPRDAAPSPDTSPHTTERAGR